MQNEIFSNDNVIAEVLSNFFSNIIKRLGIPPECLFCFAYT